MQGKVLILDTIATNRIVLKVKLAAAFYEVIQATSLDDAVAQAQTDAPDLIVSALTQPEGGAAALSTALKNHPRTGGIPILALGSGIKSADRLDALRAGVRDVLVKPIDDILLLGRVRSLIRDHNASAEWRLRDELSRTLGLAEPFADFAPAGQCMLVSTEQGRLQHWTRQLSAQIRAKITHSTVANVLRDVQTATVPDVFTLILPPDPEGSNATLRLIAALRANASSRYAGILVLQTAFDAALAANALDLGADDIMTGGFDADELSLRLTALLTRKRRDAQMRATVRTEANAAGQDALTGLYNRRYAMPHLRRVMAQAVATERSFAVMVADLDHFKQVNDDYGHASGDAVLIEVAKRLRAGLRAGDMVARIGGEEFLIIMPGTSPDKARDTATRLCSHISSAPFDVPGSNHPIPITISIGMAIGGGLDPDAAQSDNDACTDLLDCADKALYSAKMRGRNRVTLSRPAA